MVGDLCIRIGCLDHRYLRTVFAARDVCHQASFTDDISACEYGYNFNRSSCATNKAAPHRQNPAKLFRMYYFMFDPACDRYIHYICLSMVSRHDSLFYHRLVFLLYLDLSNSFAVISLR